MLHSFKCNNCYSFGNIGKKNTISMVSRESFDIISTLQPLPRGGINLWPVASIYGSNASGKSKYIKAIENLFKNITNKGQSLIGERFLFDYDLVNEPIHSEIIFSLKKPKTEDKFNEFMYGYELFTDENGNVDKVDSEWLIMRELDSNEEAIIVFERKGNKVCFDESVSKNAKDILKPGDTTLILQLAGKVGINDEPFSSILLWCYKVLPTELFSEEHGKWQIDKVAERIQRDNKFKNHFMKIMKGIDGCIHDIKVIEEGGSYSINIVHKMQNPPPHGKATKEVSIFKESYGTQKIAGIINNILYALDDGGLLLIDELDIKLHSWVFRDIIAPFHNYERNKGGQIIFSAHSLATLNSNDIHIDEIYFTEKDEHGKSTIARLNKSHISPKELCSDVIDYGAIYLNGRFGALPNEIKI